MLELQCRTCGGVVHDRSNAIVRRSERTVGVPMPHGRACRCRAPVVDAAIEAVASRPLRPAERGAKFGRGKG
jgi:hypothetical protein